MIELLLAADAALERGELDLAERLFTQVADADPRNAIAHVGVARVALRRGRGEDARAALRRALEIDPQEAAAQRLLAELDAASAEPPPPAPADQPRPAPAESRPPAPAEQPRLAPAKGTTPPRSQRRSLLGRIRRWLGLSREAP